MDTFSKQEDEGKDKFVLYMLMAIGESLWCLKLKTLQQFWFEAI